MSWFLTNLIASFFLPPINGALPAFLGLALLRRKPRLGRTLVFLGLLVVVLESLPIVAKGLLVPLEFKYPTLLPEAVDKVEADAVVVLGSGRYRLGPEFGGWDDVRGLALERLRYGALVARKAGLPILVSGGNAGEEGPSEAEIMRVSLERDFGMEVRWLEDASTNTRGNARYSAQILLPQNVRRIVLVTHAFHMPRSAREFERAGFTVIPAPMGYLSGQGEAILIDYLPRYATTRDTGYALHEWIGLLWYSVSD